MQWFGWLTKSQMEVSNLDKLTFFAELVFLIALVIIGLWICSEIEFFFRRRR
jgi:amino acid transporter